jgi:hypothetical protein
MRENGAREKVRFAVGGTECVAWHYPGTNGACVIMAGGFAVTKEPGTDLFAKRFWDSFLRRHLLDADRPAGAVDPAPDSASARAGGRA